MAVTLPQENSYSMALKTTKWLSNPFTSGTWYSMYVFMYAQYLCMYSIYSCTVFMYSIYIRMYVLCMHISQTGPFCSTI